MILREVLEEQANSAQRGDVHQAGVVDDGREHLAGGVQAPGFLDEALLAADVGALRLDVRRVTFHMLRHSAVTNLYTLTKDIRLTQRFARHRSLVTTMVYTHPSEDDLVRAVEGLRC